MLSLLLLSLAQVRSTWAAQDLSVARISSCSADQERVLREVDRQVSERLIELTQKLTTFDLQFVKKDFIDPSHRQYTDGDPVNQEYIQYHRRIQEVFGKMLSASQAGLNFQCMDSHNEPHCRNGEVIAYVLFTGNHAQPRLYACTSFFKGGSSLQTQATTTLHELSHYAADTEDWALDWWNPKHPDLNRGAEDAYHYEQFMFGDIKKILKNKIWSWLWPAPPTG